MHLSPGLIGAGCLKGMQRLFAPIAGAPGSKSCSLLTKTSAVAMNSVSVLNAVFTKFEGYWIKTLQSLEHLVKSSEVR